MLQKKLNENSIWRNVSIEKEKSKQILLENSLDKPYCIKINNNWVAQRREIKLAKMWNIYDLAQEFLPPESQYFYQQPNKPRPANNEDDYLSDDDDNDSNIDINDGYLQGLYEEN